MKTVSDLALLFLYFFTGLFMPHANNQPSQEERLVNETINSTAQHIEKRYANIKPCGEGAAMHGGIVRELVLAFETSGPFTKETLRQLLIESAQEMLDQINANQDLRPFLVKYPFTIENVQIIIYNHDKNDLRVYDPEIAIADISQGILMYKTADPESIRLKFKNRFSETYAEALAIIKNSATCP